MGAPRGPIGKASAGMLDQASDHLRGQRPFSHIGKRLIIDDVVVIASTQQFKKVDAALASRRAKPSEACIANLCAEAVGALVARAGIVNRNPGGAR